MTIYHTTPGGIELYAPSEEALERGWEYYNSPKHSKDEFVQYCAAHGIDIMEDADDPYYQSGQKLVEEWECVVAYTFAVHGNPG